MKYTFHIYLILLTVAVIAMAWITDQIDTRPIQILIVVLAILSGIAIIAARMMSRRGEKVDSAKRMTIDFGHRERKSGLTWGGGNIKGSNASRGTKRKFLGK
ncbi:MAG: hypothetical protein QNK35_16525 [Bacteroides sp.]|nr:hypothetical protein [Bacteroides sp.]